jgi:EAL domain-containing protein (putative c-di-GMP-specific phosphodiesterase class I)
VPLAVNVSIRQLADPGFVAEVQAVLHDTGLPPRLLEIEVTESGLMQNMQSMTVLRGLKALGVRIAIDDFGTGYSSLAYLATLPVDVLKIDKSFVDALPGQPEEHGHHHRHHRSGAAPAARGDRRRGGNPRPGRFPGRVRLLLHAGLLLQPPGVRGHAAGLV